MPEEQPDFDHRQAELEARIASLHQHLPPQPPALLPPPARPATRPITMICFILYCFALAGGVLLIRDLLAIYVWSDGQAFVSREGDRFHVWRDVWAFQDGTGKEWVEQHRGTTDLQAVYHNAKRDYALESVGSHLLLLVLSVLALRKLWQFRAAVVSQGPQTTKESAG